MNGTTAATAPRRRAVSVFLKRSSHGRVTLDFVLPAGAAIALPGRSAAGSGSKPAAQQRELLKAEDLSALFSALLGTMPGGTPAGKSPGSDLYVCGESSLVKFRGKVIASLTRRELALLAFLVANSPKVISRREIISKVWRTAAVENLVDTHLFNMRRKLPPRLAERIQAMPGRGFRYYAPGIYPRRELQ